jgi:SAM domain (Sterile alpha motif)
MDLSAWLRSLGLGQYEQAFRDNAIGPDVLPQLTAEDLKEFGVVPVGRRRILLDAIAALTAPAVLIGDGIAMLEKVGGNLGSRPRRCGRGCALRSARR